MSEINYRIGQYINVYVDYGYKCGADVYIIIPEYLDGELDENDNGKIIEMTEKAINDCKSESELKARLNSELIEYDAYVVVDNWEVRHDK